MYVIIDEKCFGCYEITLIIDSKMERLYTSQGESPSGLVQKGTWTIGET